MGGWRRMCWSHRKRQAASPSLATSGSSALLQHFHRVLPDFVKKKSNFACAMRHQELVHFTASVCAYLCGPGSSPWRSGRRWCPAWFSAMWWCKGGMMRETGTPFFCTNWSSTGYIQNVQYNNALYNKYYIKSTVYIILYIQMWNCESTDSIGSVPTFQVCFLLSASEPWGFIFKW